MQFTKNNNSGYQDALLKEAKGLMALSELIVRNNIAINIPQIHAVNESTLSLEQINKQIASKEQWHHFGDSLAKLHSIEHEQFGLEYNNFIGLNPQTNELSENWGEFFFKHRLTYQVEIIKSKMIKSNFLIILNAVKTSMIDFLNQNCVKASLLHGVLWSGNVLFDEQDVWLIDPAVYYGDSEADIAMTELFGGFPSEFYQSYQVIKPLSKVYPSKRTIYNLYHYLNHYNLFGSSYLPSCQSAFQQINQGFA